jgi:hypothetical protein
VRKLNVPGVGGKQAGSKKTYNTCEESPDRHGRRLATD